MKKMLLLAPYLLAAAIVLVLIVMALRDDTVPEPAPVTAVADAGQPAARADVEPVAEPVAPGAETAPEEPAAEQLDSAELMMLLRDFGFGQRQDEWREWAMSRGYPALDSSGSSHLYDQPYDQYDDDVLRGLAENGDMWAQQILANRLSRTDPAEALELYRQAAIRGSIYAMTEMAGLYGRIADSRREVEFKSEDRALEQIYAMRDAPVSPAVAGYAWTAVAELAGTEPMFGNIAASQFNRTLSDEEKEEGCELARGMYEEISEERATLGLDDFDRKPPPIVYWDPDASPSCGGNDGPRLDLSGCRKVETTEGGQTNTIWICTD